VRILGLKVEFELAKKSKRVPYLLTVDELA
jgi:hypothetical protein